MRRIDWMTTWYSVKRDYMLYIMLLPVVIFFIVFMYRPMIGLKIAFQEFDMYKGMDNSLWVGFDNFISFFKGPYFIRTLTNTFAVSIYSLIFGFPAPIILALLFNEIKNARIKSIGQTITYLPYFISSVVVAGIVTNVLAPESGLVNIVINKLGGESIYFLTKKEYIRTIFVTTGIWQSAGFGAIIYASALAAIDVEQYEAAVVDGASRFKQLLYITMPCLMPTISIMLILKIGSLLSVGYEMVILLYQPATYEKIDVINSYVYRAGLIDGDYSLAATAGLFNSIASLILVFGANLVVKKMSNTGIW